MKKDKTHYYFRRLVRIERKCDTIIKMLIRRCEDGDLDRTINLMHIQARRMKDQAVREAQILRNTFSSRMH